MDPSIIINNSFSVQFFHAKSKLFPVTSQSLLPSPVDHIHAKGEKKRTSFAKRIAKLIE